MEKEKHKHKLNHACFLSSPSFFFVLSLLTHQLFVVRAQDNVSVGVVLDLDSVAGKRSKTTISMAFDDFYAVNPNFKTRVVLEYTDSMNDVVSAASAALDLLKNSEVHAILGPQTSTETAFVANMCNKSQVPLLSFSATSPSISPYHLPFFIRANINDSAQSIPIASFIQHFNWRNVVPIYEDSEYGSGIIPSLVDALQSVDVDIPDRVVIPTESTDERIDVELYKLKTLQTRVFVMHMLPQLASRLFLRAEAANMMSKEYVWIVTDSVGNVFDTLDINVIHAMEGVIGFRPYVVPTNATNDFSIRFKARFRQDNPGIEAVDPNVYQFWAYDALQAMAMAVEVANVTNTSFIIPQNGTTDLSTIGISQTGAKLLNEILNTTFDGLAGKFQLVDNELQLSAFEIVNVVGKSARSIGFWTENKGILREINPSKGSNDNNDSMRSIIWPGDSTNVPKGWEIPTEGPKLRIGIPVKKGFNEFVNINNSTNEVTGFCIDIFEDALRKLPYDLPFEYFPFIDSLDSYDNFVYQVYLKKFDAVVGDITIRYNRTDHVGFTLPFTESGVSMVVAIQQDTSTSMWIFLKPLTTWLWLASMMFFIFTGFVVWVIEHRINPEFRGTPWQQFGLIYYFAFSTLVFAHKEKLESNLSRFAVIIWVFVVLILTSSYTASLTSMLTVQQLQPTVTDLSQLKNGGDYVGYQDGSFVKGLLTGLGFDENKLKNYSTPDEYAEALAKGSANGGVSAIFDEIPYLKVFLSQYCDSYTMIGPTYKTAGFAFGFPIGSPLLSDMSRAILSVTEGNDMTQAEDKWKLNVTCPSQITSLSSSSLSFRSFGGLFIITGSASGFMLLCHLAMFIYKERTELAAMVTPHRTPLEILRLWFGHHDAIDRYSPSVRRYLRSSLSLARGNEEGSTVRVAGSTERMSPTSPMTPASEMNFAPLQHEGLSPETEGASPSNGDQSEPLEEVLLTEQR